MPVIATLSGITTWPVLMVEVAALVPECPGPIIQLAAKEACREFFSRSYCWRQRDVTLLTTVAGQGAYSYAVPNDAELLRVHSCWNGQDEVHVALPGEEDDAYTGETDSDFRIGVSQDRTGLTLSPAPSSSGTVLTGSVSFALASNAAGIPTWCFNQFKEELAAGAAARLVLQPGKPWTDRAAYAAHRNLFDSGIRDASNEAGPVARRPLRTRPA